MNFLTLDQIPFHCISRYYHQTVNAFSVVAIITCRAGINTQFDIQIMYRDFFVSFMGDNLIMNCLHNDKQLPFLEK